MRMPSTKSLVAAFRDLDTKGANLMRRIGHMTDRDALRELLNSELGIVASSFTYEAKMQAFDHILGTHGVEGIGPRSCAWSSKGHPWLYCNAGDTYATTLIWTRDTDTVRIGTWGDIVERHDRKGTW